MESVKKKIRACIKKEIGQKIKQKVESVSAFFQKIKLEFKIGINFNILSFGMGVR
jgi:hypothetical protein